jgi:hypothetical protein
MTEHQLEKIHNYTKFKVVELLIKKHKDGITLKNFEEIENLSDDILSILGLVGAQFYAEGNR